MAETLKKYRVRTVDGTIKYIGAKNIHDAKSIARIEIGQLPNDVNLKIVKKVLAELQDDIDYITKEHNQIKADSKNLDWDNVNKRIKNIATQLLDKSTAFSQMAGSMVRINNEEK